jgi:aspartate--ammonia ligase
MVVRLAMAKNTMEERLTMRLDNNGENNLPGLNGDICLESCIKSTFRSFIKGEFVLTKSVAYQLEMEGKMDRTELYFHKRLLENSLPLSIVAELDNHVFVCFPPKAHIGEIQAIIWPDDSATLQNIRYTPYLR